MPLHKTLTNLKIVNVFSTRNEGGNPCAVIENVDNCSTQEMQRTATELNLPETVYLMKDRNHYLLRFFATKKEHPLCYHGILGAAYYLHKQQGLECIDLVSYTDRNNLAVKCVGNLVSVSIPNDSKPIKNHINIETICKLLRLDKNLIDKNLACCVASVGNPKLFIPIKDRATLFALKPHLNLIARWCQDQNVNGIYAYSLDTEDPNSDYVGRNFNPLFSHHEDIATGSAAAALCQLLFQSLGVSENNFIIEQGANLKSPSKIIVSLTETTLEITGEAYFNN